MQHFGSRQNDIGWMKSSSLKLFKYKAGKKCIQFVVEIKVNSFFGLLRLANRHGTKVCLSTVLLTHAFVSGSGLMNCWLPSSLLHYFLTDVKSAWIFDSCPFFNIKNG